MRLSEAIRLGSTLKPQAVGGWDGKKMRIVRRQGFPWFRIETVGTSCALNAAYEATTGGKSRKVVYLKGTEMAGFRGARRILQRDEIVEEYYTPTEFHAVFYVSAPCPKCGLVDEVKRIVPHLNDRHRLTRTEIADWVETIENQQAEPLPEILEATVAE